VSEADGSRPPKVTPRQGQSLCGLKQLCLLRRPEFLWFLQGTLVFSEAKHWLRQSWLILCQHAGKFSLMLVMDSTL